MSNFFNFLKLKKTVLKLFFYLFFDFYSYYFFCMRREIIKKEIGIYTHFVYNCIIM